MRNIFEDETVVGRLIRALATDLVVLAGKERKYEEASGFEKGIREIRRS